MRRGRDPCAVGDMRGGHDILRGGHDLCGGDATFVTGRDLRAGHERDATGAPGATAWDHVPCMTGTWSRGTRATGWDGTGRDGT